MPYITAITLYRILLTNAKLIYFYAGSSYFLNDRHKTTFKFNFKIYWLNASMVQLFHD